MEEVLMVINANTKLIAFLHKQRDTIARLHARIRRMQVGSSSTIPNRDKDTATVLMDASVDTGFLLKPHRDSTFDLTHMQRPNI